ncbi:MAG: hypothetical protein HZB66_03385 [Candidatus Aenigmarchaeota archaeon]|nr:hypothetical protein [Candidatus Aenigmarchaeota archaeon]
MTVSTLGARCALDVILREARLYMERQHFDGALDLYNDAAELCDQCRNDELREKYSPEVRSSLELLGKREQLKKKLADAEEEVREAEEEYRGTEGCGSEHTAAYYSLTGLKLSGWTGIQREELKSYESKLLYLWRNCLEA